MTFCRITQVFNDSPGSLRVPNFTLSCKIGTGMLSATPEDCYATPLGVATPSLGSPAIQERKSICVHLGSGYFAASAKIALSLILTQTLTLILTLI